MAPSLSVNGIYKFKKPSKRNAAPRPILPGDLGILKEIEQERQAKRDSTQSEMLEYLTPLKHFNPFPDPKSPPPCSDIPLIIECLHKRMWVEFPQQDNHFTIPAKTVAETAEFRKNFPPLITVNQLYGVYPRNTTHVDRTINDLVNKDEIKLIQNHAVYTSDLVIESSKFYSMLSDPTFSKLCHDNPSAVWFDQKQLKGSGIDIQSLVHSGFLTRDTGNPGIYFISIPQQGMFQKLIREYRTLVIKTINQCNKKFQEMPESQLVTKIYNSKKFWSQLRGIQIEWILYDAIGGGYLDGFGTPMGRGWKILKK